MNSAFCKSFASKAVIYADTQISNAKFVLILKSFMSLDVLFTQVYEQLYDTLDVTGNAEIRAHATAKVSLCLYKNSDPHYVLQVF